MNKIESSGEDAASSTSSILSNLEFKDQQNHSDKTTNQYASNWFILVDKSVEESLNFREILKLFNCAINQEQAWAVLNECLIEFRYILENNLELIKLNQDKIDINLISFVKDGSILFAFDKITQKNSASSSSFSSLSLEKHSLELKVLRSMAYLIFDSLDYGNNYLNEPSLQSSLENLLILMSGHHKEFKNIRVSEDDEGYEQEEDVFCIDKAIEICCNNEAESEYHYKAVCRGLYAQAYELKTFLAKIEHSKNTLQTSGEDTTRYCFEVLDKTGWAKLWMQVIHELKNGVKFRKVCKTHELLLRRHIEYELTPFEILLDQIRARRYHLKKVSLNNSIGLEMKKDAREIILDYIKSRPPLKNSSRRSLNPKIFKKDEPINLHEQLMFLIKNYSTPLRKISIDKNNQSMNSSENQDHNESKHQKRLLKADKNLLNNLTSSDDDDSDINFEELQNLSILQEKFKRSQSSCIFTRNNNLSGSLNYSCNRKRRIKAPDSLKSPLSPWCEPVEIKHIDYIHKIFLPF